MSKQQNKSKPNKNLNNLYTNNPTTQEVDSFITDPGTKTHRVASVETTLKMHDKFNDVFPGI